MVLDIHGVLYPLILIFAFLTAILGIFLLNALFGNKIKELFSDTKYFIFFFLICGYSIYALGELTWYLIFTVFEEIPTAGMPDFYWVVGTLLMLSSFFVLSKTLYKEYGQNKLPSLLLGGALLLILVIGMVVVFETSNFLGYFYPIIGSLIVILSTNLILFYNQLETFETNLVYLFFSNIGFLVAELIYTYTTSQEIYGLWGAFADFLYLLSYALSALAFLILLIRFYSTSKK